MAEKKNTKIQPQVRNLNRIRQMSVEELLKLLVHRSMARDWSNYDVDEDYRSVKYKPVYYSPSGNRFDTWKEAADDCIKWLNATV